MVTDGNVCPTLKRSAWRHPFACQVSCTQLHTCGNCPSSSTFQTHHLKLWVSLFVSRTSLRTEFWEAGNSFSLLDVVLSEFLFLEVSLSSSQTSGSSLLKKTPTMWKFKKNRSKPRYSFRRFRVRRRWWSDDDLFFLQLYIHTPSTTQPLLHSRSHKNQLFPSAYKQAGLEPVLQGYCSCDTPIHSLRNTAANHNSRRGYQTNENPYTSGHFETSFVLQLLLSLLLSFFSIREHLRI